MKVFEENRHQFLLNKKIEEQKLANNMMGFENRNLVFQYEDNEALKAFDMSFKKPTKGLNKLRKASSKATYFEKDFE